VVLCIGAAADCVDTSMDVTAIPLTVCVTTWVTVAIDTEP